MSGSPADAVSEHVDREARPWFAAHELYTCLNALRGASELLLSGAAGPLSAEGLMAAGTVVEAARALETHLRHCQAIDRLRAKPRPTPRPVLLGELLAGIVDEEPPEVTVLAAAGEIRAALELLGARDGGAVRRLRVLERRRLALLGPETAGEGELPVPGGILWTLLALRVRRGGGRLLPGEGGVPYLLLRRVKPGSRPPLRTCRGRYGPLGQTRR